MHTIASRLQYAVRTHSQTPIEVWDGIRFTPFPVKVDIKAGSHRESVLPFSIMGVEGNDPIPNYNTIRDPSGQVWNIVKKVSNTYGTLTYGTTYTLVEAPYKGKVLSHGSSSSPASSGFDYGTTPDEVATVWTTVQHDRYFNSPRPIQREAMSQVLECFIPLDNGLTKGMKLILDNGYSYKIETVDLTLARSSYCFVTPLDSP